MNKNTTLKKIEELFTLTQEELHPRIAENLIAIYGKENVIITNEYICAKGDIPIALVAHMDTVWEDVSWRQVFYDPNKNVFFGSCGLGADDRAGIWAISLILKDNYCPHIIITTDEESGGYGAQKLVTDGNPFNGLKYIIELDRQGGYDCVFYNGINQKFQHYIESFGFSFARGSFSDISFICPGWEVCGVNLSIGYINEHTQAEMLYLRVMLDTIRRVECMLDDCDNAPQFVWQEKTYSYTLSYLKNHECCCCGKPIPKDSEFIVKVNSTTAYLCPNCVADHAAYCSKCGHLFLDSRGISYEGFCEDCRKKEENL